MEKPQAAASVCCKIGEQLCAIGEPSNAQRITVPGVTGGGGAISQTVCVPVGKEVGEEAALHASFGENN